MSWEQDLIDAIQTIALANEEKLSAKLQKIARKGTLPKEIGQAGGAGEYDECCDSTAEDTVDETPTDDITDIPDDGDMGDEIGELCGLTDCATGEPVCVNMSGDYKIPDGWDDINTGYKENYIEGYYWQTYQYTPVYGGYTPNDVKSNYSLNFTGATVDGDSVGGSYTGCIAYRYTIGASTYNLWICPRQCPDTSAPHCNPSIDDITEDQWPCDGIPQIGFIDGRFMTHNRDCDGSDYIEPRDDMVLCDGDGDRLRLVADKFEDGGFLTVPVDANGNPIEGRVIGRYKKNGARYGTISADQVSSYAREPVNYNY